MSQFGQKKTIAQDLSEGKFDFPIIHAIHSGHPDSGKVLEIVKQRTESEDVKLYCVSLLEKIGSLAYTKKKLEQLEKDIRQERNSLGGNPLLEDFVGELVPLVSDQ